MGSHTVGQLALRCHGMSNEQIAEAIAAAGAAEVVQIQIGDGGGDRLASAVKHRVMK
jgi:hypothetical protein